MQNYNTMLRLYENWLKEGQRGRGKKKQKHNITQFLIVSCRYKSAICCYVDLLLTTMWRKVPSGCTFELELSSSFQTELNCNPN